MLRSLGVIAVATIVALAASFGALRVVGHADATPPAPQGAVRKSADGHFWADADVDGRKVRFLVDTGSSAVTLTADDARRIGLDPSRLVYDHPVATAGGRERAAEVLLTHIAVDGARVDRVPALIMRRGLGASLLGMSYLGRLSGFRASRDLLILTP